jgi:hypothetical protein
MRFYLILLTFCSSFVLAWPAGHIIYNSTTAANQKIALGILPEGHMGVSVGNIATNASYTGISYKMSGAWKDATTPGCLCEGWGVGAQTPFGRFQGEAGEDLVWRGVNNLEVKSFVVDETSIESTVWIKDRSGNAALEIKHVYSPSALRPDELFEAVVTMTNISGNTIWQPRYNRTMDWDIPPTEFREIVTYQGIRASATSRANPKIFRSGNNGFRNPNVFASHWWSYIRDPESWLTRDRERLGPADHGFSATFDFDNLQCGESHTFKIYYGAAETRALILEALAEEGVSIYSLGEASHSSKVTYAFGFKGLSGTALAPSLPEKIAILPGGVKTSETKVQTYATPVIIPDLPHRAAYQAVFKFRKDHQWEGDILRYALDADGNFMDRDIFGGRSVSENMAMKKMTTLAHINQGMTDFTAVMETKKGRNIWTVGYDPNCPGDATPFKRGVISAKIPEYPMSRTGTLRNQKTLNNFVEGYTNNLDELIYNCGTESTTRNYDTRDLIRFVRGYDVLNEDPPRVGTAGYHGLLRKSLLADTFHSDLVYVGPPVGSLSSSNSKTEAYFRNANGYAAFKETYKDRPNRLYVGANDGMLHAFDQDLNEIWAFIPPSVLPKLPGLMGKAGTGKTNTKWLVDGPIIVKDVYINATSEWKTILVGGLGWGGTGYYVLDITDAYAPEHLFTVNNDVKNKQVSYYSASGYKTTYDYAAAPDNMDYSGLGKTWARPSIILLPYSEGSTQQRYVMAFGAGYAGGTSTGLGNFVYVLDFEPSSTTFSDPVTGTSMPTMSGGNVIKKIAIAPDSASDIPNGVTAHMSVVTADAASPSDFWGGIAYFPDLTGQLWKLDMSKTGLGETNSSMWTLTKAFRSEGTLANDRFGYNQMATTLVNSSTPIGTNVFNYFGTGDQAHLQRRDATIKNRIYGVKDLDFPDTDLATTGSSKTISSSGIFKISGADASSSWCSSVDVPGWYADVLDVSSLDTGADDFIKVVGRPLATSDDVYFTLYRPDDLACPIGGKSQVVKMIKSCAGGYSVIATGAGLSTAPVMDSEGNIYVGVGNLATDGELDIEASESEERSGVDNILKIGSSDISASASSASSSSNPGIRIKSWRQLPNKTFMDSYR